MYVYPTSIKLLAAFLFTYVHRQREDRECIMAKKKQTKKRKRKREPLSLFVCALIVLHAPLLLLLARREAVNKNSIQASGTDSSSMRN